MIRCAATWCGAFVLLAGGGAQLAAQSAFTLSGIDGRFGARLLRNWSSNPTYPTGVYSLETTEWVVLRAEGVVVDPRLFQFGATIQPQWTQNGGTKGTGDRFRSLAWAANASVLHNGRPYWLEVLGGQSMAVRRDQTGFAEDRWLTHYEGKLTMVFPGLPSSLQYRHDGQSTAFGSTDPLSYSTRSLRLNAANSKLSVLLERLWQADASGIGDGQWIGSAAHRHRWGTGSSWASRLGYFRYDGGGGQTRFSWSEQGRLRHSQRVSSDLAFGFHAARSDVAASTIWDIGYGISYPLGWGLAAGTRVGSQWARRRTARDQRLSVAQLVGFGYGLPAGMRLTGTGSVGVVRFTSSVGSDGFADVVAEEHVVSPDGTFLLENPGVEASSIRIWPADRTLQYQTGLDYGVLESGPFTLVTLAPGSRIAIGDTVSVDYVYALPTRGPSDQLAAEANAQLERGPAQAFLHVRRTRPLSELPPDDGEGFYLTDLDETELGFRITGQLPFGHASGSATRVSRRTGDLHHESTSLYGGLKMNLPSRLVADIGGGVNWSEALSNQSRNRSRALNVTGSLTWTARRFFKAWASGGVWSVSQDASDFSRTQLGGRVGISFVIARLSAEMDYQVRRSTERFRQLDERFSVRLERRF